MLKIIYEERGLTLRHKTFSKARDMIEMYKLERYPNYYLDLITMSLDTLRQKYLRATDVNDIIFMDIYIRRRNVLVSITTIF